jgi:hypothetical protein
MIPDPTREEIQKADAAIEKASIVGMGSRDQVKELQVRIVKMLPSLMPQSGQLTEPEALALAQVAILHGLSPFTQEIYFLKSGDRSLGVMPGIRGYRKAAKRQLPPGESYWLEFVPCPAKETGAEKPDDVYFAVKCILRDSVSMKRYIEICKMVAQTYEPVRVDDNSKLAEVQTQLREVAGPPPLYVGYGVVMKYELERMSKARLNPTHQAEIRAERAAIRMRFDMDIPSMGFESEAEATIIDEQTESPDMIDVQTERQETKTEEQMLKELGY